MPACSMALFIVTESINCKSEDLYPYHLAVGSLNSPHCLLLPLAEWEMWTESGLRSFRFAELDWRAQGCAQCLFVVRDFVSLKKAGSAGERRDGSVTVPTV